MTPTKTKSAPNVPGGNGQFPGQQIPPLENGANLTVVEFERRYSAMPHIKKAELINGVVFMPSPVSLDHSGPDSDASIWLGIYRVNTPGTESAGNSTIKLHEGENQLQPDDYLRILPEFGGQSGNTVDRYVDGAPELIVEIAVTSAAIDLHQKLDAYQENGVKEYIVWRVWEQAIDWFILRGGRYDRLAPDANGIYRSEVFPGLWLDSAGMIRRDLATVLRVLQQGLASPEHVAFVGQMQARAPKP